MTQSQPEFLDLYRAGLKSTADLMKASLQSVERLQDRGLAAIRGAIEAQSKSAIELSQARTVDDLLALQARLAGEQWERTMSFWSDLVSVASENQRNVIGRLQEQARWLSS